MRKNLFALGLGLGVVVIVAALALTIVSSPSQAQTGGRAALPRTADGQIGRASCRERV